MREYVVSVRGHDASLALGSRRGLQGKKDELGHEYFWDEYSRAMADHDDRRMQELELRCDGIAVLTLRQLALDPDNLVRAVTSLTRYNERLGAVASADSYVSLGDRVKFIRAVQRLFDHQGQRPTGRVTPRFR